jgi:hypothetical protein
VTLDEGATLGLSVRCVGVSVAAVGPPVGVSVGKLEGFVVVVWVGDAVIEGIVGVGVGLGVRASDGLEEPAKDG